MLQPQVKTAINAASTTNCNFWALTFAGVATDTQTVTIGGVAFKTMTALGTTAGNVLIGSSINATVTNLVNAINDPGTTTSTFVKLSAANCNTLEKLKLRTSGFGYTVYLQSSVSQDLTVSETQDNASWGSNTYCSNPIEVPFSGKVSIQMTGEGVASGNGVFSVDVSNDNRVWTAYNRLTTNVTNTNSQTDLRAASVTLNTAGASSAIVTFPASDQFAFMRVKVVPTTDGTYYAYVLTA